MWRNGNIMRLRRVAFWQYSHAANCATFLAHDVRFNTGEHSTFVSRLGCFTRARMSDLETLIIRSVSELRTVAREWDDLWQRSEVTAPLVRAEAIAQWYEHFTPDGEFTAVIVGDCDRFLGAVPLVKRRLAGLIPSGQMPNDPWSICGDLLFDDSVNSDAVLEILAEGMNRLRWPLFFFSATAYDAPRWQRFRAVTERRGWRSADHFDCRFGYASLEPNWTTQMAGWSAKHRRHMQRALRRAEREGGVTLRTVTSPADHEIDDLLRIGFEIEDRSWKGAAGTSVLRTPGKFELFCREARQLAACGQLHLAFLDYDGQPIAFEYGYIAKGIYFSPKIGFDADFARFTPGQLLRYLLFRKFTEERLVHAVDFWGPTTRATRKWSTSDYPRGRLILAPPRFVSRTLFNGLETAWRWKRTFCQPRDFSVDAILSQDQRQPLSEASQ